MRAKEILKKWWVLFMGIITTVVVIFGFITDVIPTIWNEIFKNKVTSEAIQFHKWISDDSYKIIILPFDEKCKDGSGDVGSLITDRLIDKSKVDSLNIEVYYKEELTPSRTLGDSATYYLYLDSADLVIWGRSMTGEWSGEGSQIWLNYETDSVVNKSSQSGYQAVTPMDITRGVQQGEIDDIVYYFCGLSEYYSLNYRRSLNLLKKIITHTYDSYYYLGNNYSFLEEYETGIEYYMKAISTSKYSFGAYLNMGVAYHSLDLDSIALKIYDSALEWVPQSTKAMINRSTSFHSLGMNTKALNDLNRALEIEPNSSLALFRRAIIKNDLNQNNEALADITKVIEQRPELAVAYNARGIIYKSIGSIHNAEKDYLKSLELNPKLAQTHYNLGHIYLGQKRLIKAKEEFNLCIKNLEHNKVKWTDRLNLISFSSCRESYEMKSLAYNFRAVVNHEIAKRTRDLFGILVDSAIIDFTTAIEFDSTYAYAYCRRGRLYAARLQFDKAIYDFSKSIELDPLNGCGYRWRAQFILDLFNNKFDVTEEGKALALRDINTAISFGQENYEEYEVRYKVYIMLERYAEAQKDLIKSNKLKRGLE